MTNISLVQVELKSNRLNKVSDSNLVNEKM